MKIDFIPIKQDPLTCVKKWCDNFPNVFVRMHRDDKRLMRMSENFRKSLQLDFETLEFLVPVCKEHFYWFCVEELT